MRRRGSFAAMDSQPIADHAGLEVPESMVYLVYLTVFIDILAAAISTPVMPYYSQSFGAPVEWIGYLYGAWSLSATVFAPMLSGMSDKWGRKFVLTACLFGAGTANLIQGSSLWLNDLFPTVRPGFWVFLFGRGFSGVWASVGATCNVYITDVAPAKSVREPYLEKLAMVPIIAILLGPGLGGALAAAFGNNAPVMVDGTITLFSAILVSCNLVETPAFLRGRMEAAQAAEEGSKQEKPVAAPVRPEVHVFGFALGVMALAGQINLSMLALFYQRVHGVTTLYLGFVFMGMAVCMLMSNMLVKPIMKNVFGLSSLSLVVLGCSLQGLCIMGMGLEGSLRQTLACQYVATIFSSLSGSQTANIISGFTEVSNRGRIFGLMQTYQNCGKIVGPILGTHIAMRGIGVSIGPLADVIAYHTDEDGQHPFGLPFLLSGSLLVLAQVFVLTVSRMQRKPSKATLLRKGTSYGEDWVNEAYTDRDVRLLGTFMANLLSQKHYRWVSQREQVEHLLETVVPALDISDKEAYQSSFELAQRCAAPCTSG